MSIGKKIRYDIHHILDILVLISKFLLQSEALNATMVQSLLNLLLWPQLQLGKNRITIL